MSEPTPRSSRLTLAGVLALAVASGGGGFWLARSTADGRADTSPPASLPAIPSATPSATAAPAATPPSVLDRAGIIALAAQAADAAAAGQAVPAAVADADGRRFDLRLPFGCEGPVAPDSPAPLRWSYDERAETLRVTATPVTWSAEAWGLSATDGAIDAIEGFVVAQPWTSSPDCPARSAELPSPSPAADLPELAVGQVHFAAGARAGRRDGDAFTAVVRTPRDAVPTDRGLRLRLTGRLTGAGMAAPVQCWQPNGAGTRPACLVGTTGTEVTIENAATGAVIGTWSWDGSGADR